MLHLQSRAGIRLSEERDGKPLPIERWMAFDSLYPAPTFFARPAWSLALARAFPYLAPCPLVLKLSTGEAVIVPLVRRRGRVLPFQLLTGLPLGSYTLALGEDGRPVSAQGAAEAVARLCGLCDRMSVNYWPLAPLSGEIPGEIDMHETALIDLAHGADHAIANMDSRALRNVHAAIRRGVTCLHDREPGNAGRYYELLVDAAKRWESGTPSISRGLIEAVVELGGDDAEIWFSYHEGAIVGGGLVLYGSEEVFFWSAAMRPEAGNLRPSNALNVALIQRAAERGMRWFNMGASEGLPGVTHFKKSLGATSMTYPSYSARKTPYSWYETIRSFVYPGRGS